MAKFHLDTFLCNVIIHYNSQVQGQVGFIFPLISLYQFYTSCILLQSFRYCQPPAKLWEWMEPYLEDEEVSYW